MVDTSNLPEKKIGANALSNLVGYILVTLIAVICTPYFIKLVGEARFGILALVWLLFGYFGVFDLGLSRATANMLARLKDVSREEKSKVFWTALILNLGLGFFGAIVFFLISKQLMSFYIKIPGDLTSEINNGLPWVALLIPLATMNGVFVATLEASEQFFKLNILQAMGSAFFHLIPLFAVATIEPRIDIAILASAIGRGMSVFLIALAALQIVDIRSSLGVNLHIARKLLHYGGWVTVFTIVGPLIVTIDQFAIGIAIGSQAVAYYSISYSVAARANIIPLSLTRALFPRFSRHAINHARDLTSRAVDLISNTTVGLYIAAIVLVRPVFTIWLGADFASHASPVAEILFVGIWLNGLAIIPFTMTQAQGRPDLVAKISLVELVPYMGVLFLLIELFGLRGAAGAWALRAAIDAVVQFKIAGLRFTGLRRMIGSLFLLIIAVVFVETTNLSLRISLGLGAFCLLIALAQLLINPTTGPYAHRAFKRLVSKITRSYFH